MKPIRILRCLLLAACVIASTRLTAALAGSVTLGWDQEDDPLVAGYMIYYGDSSGNYTNFIYVDDVASTGGTVSNLVQGVDYFFTVRVLGVDGIQSLPSAEVSFNIPLFTLYFTNSGGRNVTLVWNQYTGTNFNEYWLFQQSGGDPASIHGRGPVVFDNITNTTYSEDGLSPGSTYQFEVDVMDGIDNGTPRVASEVLYYPVPPPGQPNAFQIGATTPDSISFTWAEPDTNVVDYSIEYGNISGAYPFSTDDVQTNSATVESPDHISPGTVYYFRVMASDGVDGAQTTYSEEFSAYSAVLPGAPTPPDLYCTGTTTDSVWLAWDIDPTVDYYTVFYGTNSSNPFQFSVSPSADSIVLGGFPTGPTNYFVLMATAGGTNSYSAVIATNTSAPPMSQVIVFTNIPFSIQIEITNTSPFGEQDPENPIWLHAIFSTPVTNDWFFQDTLDLQNWNTIGPPQVSTLTEGWYSVSLATHLAADYFRVYVTTNQ